MAKPVDALHRYEAIIEKIFSGHYEKGAIRFAFDRQEIEDVAKLLKITLPKNLGDLIYSFIPFLNH